MAKKEYKTSEIHRVRSKKYRQENPEKHRASVKASYHKALAKDPDYHKRRDLVRFYGVTLDWYNETLESQGHACAICKKPQEANTLRHGKPLKLFVDHCHDTGDVRGLLCNSCNRGLGLLRHDVDILAAAVVYLSPERLT